jgi:hypothetical protein
MRAKANTCCSPSDRLRPVFDHIQFACERAKSYLLEHCSEPRRRGAAFIATGVEQRAGKSAERQIRPLRDEEHSPFAEPDFAAAERPNSGNRSQQGTLSRTGRPSISTASPRADANATSFPEAHQAEPEVGLEALPGNIQRHQRSTDFDREPNTDTGVEQCCPDQIRGYVYCSPLAERDLRRSGETPRV